MFPSHLMGRELTAAALLGSSQRPRPGRGLTIRRARAVDGAAIRRVAELDSRRVPAGPLIVAEVDGEVVAATPLAGGCVVADPFRPTAGIVRLLELRAAQLGAGAGGPDGRPLRPRAPA